MARPRPPRSLSGKVVAISGAARGIGRATAQALGGEGARVAIGDLDLELAQRTAGELGGETLALALDVTDRRSFESCLAAVEERLGPLDILVNNAGILHLGPFLEEDDPSTSRQIEVNLRGVINGMKVGLPRLRSRPEGHLVNIASSAGKLSPPGIATYAATKHAVVGLTEAVRAELLDSPVEFSIVMPGVVRTEMIAGFESARAVRDIEPEDVAAAIVAALQVPRLEVWVPRSLGPIYRVMSAVPARLNQAINRLLKADRVTWHADRSARLSYEARAAASGPGSEPAGSAREVETVAAGSSRGDS